MGGIIRLASLYIVSSPSSPSLLGIPPAKQFPALPAPPANMKSSIFVTALAMATSVFSAAVPQPIGQAVEKRQLESQLSVLDTLYAAVVEQTTQISKCCLS